MKRFFLGITILSQLAVGEEIPAGKVLGVIDIRPSWYTKSGSVGSENSIEGGYRFTKDVSLTYAQGFLSNVNSSSTSTSGLNLKADVGFIRARVGNIAELGNSGVKLSYQSRVYTPTSGWAVDSGMITTLRNYVNFTKEVIPETLTLTLSEIPIFHIFDKPGFNDAANPIVENRVYLVAEASLAKNLSLTVPVMFHQTKYSDFKEGAANNASWAFLLWTWPEIGYALTENMTVGVSYYSDNLLKADLSGFAVAEGLEKGVLQTFVTMSL